MYTRNFEDFACSLEWCLENNQEPDETEVMRIKHELVSIIITALQKDR